MESVIMRGAPEMAAGMKGSRGSLGDEPRTSDSVGLRRLVDEFSVSHRVCLDDTRQGVAEDVVVVSVVEAPLQFFEVAVHVLLAHLVERADDRALEQRPHALGAVQWTSPTTQTLAEWLTVRCCVPSSSIPRCDFSSSVDRFGIVSHVAPDELMQRRLLCIRDAFDAELRRRAASLRPPRSCWRCSPAPSASRRPASHRPRPAKQRGVVQRVAGHRLADEGAEVPSGAVRGAERPLRLVI